MFKFLYRLIRFAYDKGRTFQTIINNLQALGYKVEYRLLNSSNFNVPQNRARIYIVGVLDDSLNLKIKSDVGAADSHKFKAGHNQTSLLKFLNEKILVENILEKNPDTKHNCTDKFISQLKNVVGQDFDKLHGKRLIDTRNGNSIHSWDIGTKGKCTPDESEFMNLLIANRRKKIFGTHQDGKALSLDQINTFYTKKNIKSVSNSLVKKGYLSNYNNLFNPVCGNMSFEVFKFLDPKSISITLTASDTNRLGIVHNGVPRRLTPRECARLQGFPDSYKLLSNDKAVYKQMGNAVSVPVVESVVKDLLENNNIFKKSVSLNTNPLLKISINNKMEDLVLS